MSLFTRRDALKISGRAGTTALGFAFAECAAGQETTQATPFHRKRIGEYDPANTRVGHIVSATVSDDEVLFLRQIGLRSILVNFRPGDSALDEMRRAQERFARHNIQIFGGLNYTYRSLRIQLGQPGRDEDIEQYQKFLRNLGTLGIPVATYDFHPANTYTTATVKNRGYSQDDCSANRNLSFAQQN